MTPEQFKTSWETSEFLSRFAADELHRLDLKESTVNFLSIAGLPADAAPFLNFAQNEEGSHNIICKLPELYSFLTPDYNRYVSIGSDGSSNPIVIDTSDDDKIFWLDHEDGFSPNYMNLSINTFAACLFAQRTFIETVLLENGEEDFSNDNFTDEQFEQLKNDLLAADATALLLPCNFWQEELDIALGMREEYSETLPK